MALIVWQIVKNCMLKNDRLTDWSANDERWISRDSDEASAREQRAKIFFGARVSILIKDTEKGRSRLAHNQLVNSLTLSGPAGVFSPVSVINRRWCDGQIKSRQKKIIISAISCRLRRSDPSPECNFVWTKGEQEEEKMKQNCKRSSWPFHGSSNNQRRNFFRCTELALTTIDSSKDRRCLWVLLLRVVNVYWSYGLRFVVAFYFSSPNTALSSSSNSRYNNAHLKGTQDLKCRSLLRCLNAFHCPARFFCFGCQKSNQWFRINTSSCMPHVSQIFVIPNILRLRITFPSILINKNPEKKPQHMLASQDSDDPLRLFPVLSTKGKFDLQLIEWLTLSVRDNSEWSIGFRHQIYEMIRDVGEEGRDDEDHLCLGLFVTQFVSARTRKPEPQHTKKQVLNRVWHLIREHHSSYLQLSECAALCCWFQLSEFESRKIVRLPMPSEPYQSTFFFLSLHSRSWGLRKYFSRIFLLLSLCTQFTKEIIRQNLSQKSFSFGSSHAGDEGFESGKFLFEVRRSPLKGSPASRLSPRTFSSLPLKGGRKIFLS